MLICNKFRYASDADALSSEVERVCRRCRSSNAHQSNVTNRISSNGASTLPTTRRSVLSLRTNTVESVIKLNMVEHIHEDSLGLTQVEPSPVEETPIESKDGYFANTNDHGTTTPPKSTSTLGLSQHNAIWYLNRIQKYSSWIFTAFGVAHVCMPASLHHLLYIYLTTLFHS